MSGWIWRAIMEEVQVEEPSALALVFLEIIELAILDLVLKCSYFVVIFFLKKK